jgi:integrase
LTEGQVVQVLDASRQLARGAAPYTIASQIYRLVVAGLFCGLRRGELQHLLASDTNGRAVVVQSKMLPHGTFWTPKDREARVITYDGIMLALRVVFEDITAGYVFSPSPARDVPFHADSLTAYVDKRLLPQIGAGLTLHSFRHTFATWRLEAGDSILQVKGMMGHSDANTLLRYAHVAPRPLANLLALLQES